MRTALMTVLLFGFGSALRGADTPLPVPTAEQIERIAAWLPARPTGVGARIDDRKAWDEAAKLPAFRKQLTEAVQFAGEPIPELNTDALFAQVMETGRRDIYEKPFRKRTTRLAAFAVAECLSNDGTYLPLIEAEVTAILTEKTWGVSTNVDEHPYGGFDGIIDLASSCRAWNLATVDYWLGDKLKPQSRALIRREVKRRIFDHYETAVRTGKPLWWWMTGKSNWNPVCTSGVVGAALTLIESPQERALFVQGALNSMPFYVGSLGDDGYCEEGVSYWAYGFGCYLCLAEELYQQTRGNVNLYQGEKLRKVALFMSRFEIVPEVYPAFGDAGARTKGRPPSLMWLIDQRWNMGWNIDVAKSDMFLKHPLGDRLFGFGLFGFPLPLQKEAPAGSPASPEEADAGDKRVYFKDESVLICRSLQPGRAPFGLAIKGGKNGLPMSHGHNDNGSYVVASGNVPLVADPGMEVYTKSSFGPHRFESMMMNSYGHSVPVIGKTLQKTGHDALGKIVETTFTDEQDTLKMDLTTSYDVPGLERVVRTFIFNRARPSVEVIDEADFRAPTEFGSAVVTLSEWKEQGPGSFLIYEREAAVQVTVTVEGTGADVRIENNIEPITAPQLPPGLKPMRLGLNLNRPVTHVIMRTLIVPAAAPSPADGPAGTK